MQKRTPLWLSHHYPGDYDRCIRFGDTHLCRRCTVLYPVVFATMFAALAGFRWAGSADPWLLWLLPVPVVIEWWGEQLGLCRYSAQRSVVLTLVCAPAVGVGLARYMQDPTDGLFWSVVCTYAVVCAAPVFIGRRARTTPPATPGSSPRRAAGRAR